MAPYIAFVSPYALRHRGATKQEALRPAARHEEVRWVAQWCPRTSASAMRAADEESTVQAFVDDTAMKHRQRRAILPFIRLSYRLRTSSAVAVATPDMEKRAHAR